ncbi:hypothetical protein FVP43_11545 [Lactococcus sp. dk322]|nr:hypothetical protein [Lactococcus sp. dk101]TXK33859.1 hypothetical protein FVP42_11455 [Lactococcus sp. dk310]TXK44951.1 hypothetical protein FVP43_11545 [Lactococcus sp. dk322]
MEKTYYTLSELAREFGTSKDLMKYHRKSLPESEHFKDSRGVIYISEVGKSMIQSRLTKKEYSPEFQKQVLQKLNEIEWKIDYTGSHLSQSNQDVIALTDRISPSESSESSDKLIMIESKYLDLKRTNEALNANYELLKGKVTVLSKTATISSSGEIRLNMDLLRDLLQYGKEIDDSDTLEDVIL